MVGASYPDLPEGLVVLESYPQGPPDFGRFVRVRDSATGLCIEVNVSERAERESYSAVLRSVMLQVREALADWEAAG